jgi:hypothetical protein
MDGGEEHAQEHQEELTLEKETHRRRLGKPKHTPV